MRTTLQLLSLCLLSAAVTVAQPAPESPRPGETQEQKEGEKEGEKEEEKEGPEGEFVASDIFRSGLFIAPVWKKLNVEAHYFGTEGKAPIDTLIGGVSWAFRWKELTLAPGISVSGGWNVQTAPVFTFRWALKSEHWISEGAWLQSLRPALEEAHGHEEEAERFTRYASILDNIHVSARIGRFELGPTVERVQYRDENEWKGGARVGFRVHRHVRLLFYALGPGREFRGGIGFQ